MYGTSNSSGAMEEKQTTRTDALQLQWIQKRTVTICFNKTECSNITNEESSGRSSLHFRHSKDDFWNSELEIKRIWVILRMVHMTDGSRRAVGLTVLQILVYCHSIKTMSGVFMVNSFKTNRLLLKHDKKKIAIKTHWVTTKAVLKLYFHFWINTIFPS